MPDDRNTLIVPPVIHTIPPTPLGIVPPTSSAVRPGASIDPRVDGLSERVRALEHALGLLLKSPKGPEDLLRDQQLGTANHQNHLLEEDEDVPNQFVVGTSPSDDVTLSSQVAAISALLSRPPSPKIVAQRPSSKAGLLVEFPDPQTLQHLMDVYFHEFDGYFPFLERSTTEPRIQMIMRSLGYSSYNCSIMVPVEILPTIALACIMLAMGECLDPSDGACDGDKKPGWGRYLQCRRAIQRYSETKPLPLDLISAQTLVAVYLMQSEALGPASSAITVVWQLATSARLINQRVWPIETPAETLQRRKLWWTIYFLDRQISRRSGFAYHIRDIEFDVEDFTSVEPTSFKGPKAQRDQLSSDTGDYFQALINLARLWGNVWDTFFAVGRPKKGDWMEVEIMDARILNTRRQLPNTLTWDSNDVGNYVSAGESEPHIRRRIQIYTVSNNVNLSLTAVHVNSNTYAETQSSPPTYQAESCAPSNVCSRNCASVFKIVS